MASVPSHTQQIISELENRFCCGVQLDDPTTKCNDAGRQTMFVSCRLYFGSYTSPEHPDQVRRTVFHTVQRILQETQGVMITVAMTPQDEAANHLHA